LVGVVNIWSEVIPNRRHLGESANESLTAISPPTVPRVSRKEVMRRTLLGFLSFEGKANNEVKSGVKDTLA